MMLLLLLLLRWNSNLGRVVNDLMAVVLDGIGLEFWEGRGVGVGVETEGKGGWFGGVGRR